MNFKGVIIEESLEDKSVLKELNILQTDIKIVTEKYKTPWLKQWTLHTFEIDEGKADMIAETVSKGLESEHNWYADFKNDKTHYIVYKNKIFKVNRTRADQYLEAKKYGISLGIPEYQVDFSPEVVIEKK